MLAYHETCGADVCSLLEENATATSIFTRLADGEDLSIRFLAEINYADIDLADASNWETEGDIGSLAIAEDTLESGGVSAQQQLLFSDGGWIGKPSDIARPNTLYESRLLDPASISKRIPIAPEVGRRAQTQFGDIRAAGADGELDDTTTSRTIDGRTIKLFVGPRNGGFVDFSQILEAIGDDITADPVTTFFGVKNISTLLDVPLQSSIYEGTGGINGDSGLQGRARPLLFGECFNVTPVLMNVDRLIYDVHNGQVNAIDAVKDRGQSLTWDGNDYADYTSLRGATIAAGQFAKATAIGKFRLGANPDGDVTADVRGDVNAGVYTDETGDILQRLAIGPAFLVASQIDFSGFNALPSDKIGYYYDGSQTLLVSDVFDQLLRPLNGWYGQLNDARLAVGLVDKPEAANSAWALTSTDIIDIEETPISTPPRFAQRVSYARNWTPMSLDELALGGLTDSEIEALTSEKKWHEEMDQSVKQRFPGSERGPDVDGFFVEQSGAQGAARDRIMALLKEARREITVRTKLQGLNINLNTTGTVTHPRFGLSSGVAVTVVATNWNLARSEVELSCIA